MTWSVCLSVCRKSQEPNQKSVCQKVTIHLKKKIAFLEIVFFILEKISCLGPTCITMLERSSLEIKSSIRWAQQVQQLPSHGNVTWLASTWPLLEDDLFGWCFSAEPLLCSTSNATQTQWNHNIFQQQITSPHSKWMNSILVDTSETWVWVQG